MNRLFEHHPLGKGKVAQETVPVKSVVALKWPANGGCPGFNFGHKKPEGV